MLILWTSAKAETLIKYAGPTLVQQRVPYSVVSDMTKFPSVNAGDVVLACGAEAIQILQTHKVVPKGRTVTSLREGLHQCGATPVFVTFDAGAINQDYARLPEFQWDIHLACRYLKFETLAPQIGTYRWVENFNDLVTRIEELYNPKDGPVAVACDLETLGLDEYNPEGWIISISFTVDAGKSDLIYFEKGETPWVGEAPWEPGLWEQILWLLTTPKVALRGANFKYDSRWITQKWGISCTNHTLDTVLAGSLVDENRSNGLKLHSKIYTDLGGYDSELDKNYDKSRMDLVPKDVLLTYAGGDTDATFRVAIPIKEELLRDKAALNFYKRILHPASRAFENVERTGICVDVPYYEALGDELRGELVRLENELFSMVPQRIKVKYIENLSITRPAILGDFLFNSPHGLKLKPKLLTTKTGKPSVAKEHLMQFADHPVAGPFVSLFGEYAGTSKTLSTFVTGFLKHLRSDGRFHPTYMLFRGDYEDTDSGAITDSGTVTGRTSAKDPPTQIIPKRTRWAKRIRRAFIAPPGYTILSPDYSQGELKITACVANETSMIEAYAHGLDLHAKTAAKLSGYSLDDFMELPDDLRELKRNGGKAGNFGLIYGLEAPGYKEYAYNSYGVKLTDEEAYQAREAFFELYPKLLDWHTEYKQLAHKHEYIRSPLGRIRHLPLINGTNYQMRAKQERQGINSPIQSCLSDLMQYAMVLIQERYGIDDAPIFMMTHDSIHLYVPIPDALVWAKRVKDVMENLPLKENFGWDHQLPFTVDCEVAVPDDDGVYSLAYMKKLKNL